MTDLLLNKAHFPVSALGPGTRAGIWVQGCTIACHGCVSRDTWAADPQLAVPIATVLGWLASLPRPLDGVTISGGEPFQQPEALRRLLEGIDVWRATLGKPLDILVYSGYPLAHLRRHHAGVLALCDAVIAGPYVERRNIGLRWRGSENQEIAALTPLGHERYDEVDDTDIPAVQVTVDAGRIWYIGIPRRGDLERAAAHLEAAGIRQREPSWRT